MRKVNVKNEISAKCKSLVGKIFDYVDIPDTKALRWGRAMAEVSVNQYKTLEKKKYAAFELHISESNPWIAGFPDSIINCQCCGSGDLEVKNPYKYRDHSIHQIVVCACTKNPSSKCKPMTKSDYCLVMSDDGSIRLAERNE